MSSSTTTTATTSSEQLSNLHEVTSPDHFQTLLSEDLNRISLINFWAPWAEPCTQMNKVVEELAKKYPKLLVLQVEAETQYEISESFDIEAVPSFLLLRGHTLLGRISGADAPALTTSVSNHLSNKPMSVQPLSTSDAKPAAASDTTTYTDEAETPVQLEKRMHQLMNQSKVVLFMKGSPDSPKCGFSRKTVSMLREQDIEFTHFDILSDERVRQGLKVLNDWPTFPQIIVKGELIGGLDIAQEMVDNGEMKELLADS
ncbi:glutaredoxin [Pterulicium gracile]|uniref:Glutaredoxin n=1 Tax=Pterulicium gracile TaxID=1884261 RepID=A0A5C3QC56_9AGAR|nr:glutaredoxin [Pterula gracilis]